MTSDQNNASPTPVPRPSRGRFLNRRLRRASWISPITGERSKRVFTLREASHRLSDSNDVSEATPLLDGCAEGTTPHNSAWKLVQRACVERADTAYTFATSKNGIGILKCSLAYLVGSLATLVPAIAALIGSRQDSKHMVCTVTVWFHPARSIGSMHEATILAIIALCYSGFVSFTSMAISMLFGRNDLLVVGHVIVLMVFVGGGLGFIAWTKQRMAHPLVNVACSLASLGCITVLIKEGAVQAGAFSHERVLQILLMVFAGVVIVSVINVILLPTTARGSLVKDMGTNTDLLGEMLISITRAFLQGRKSDLENEQYKTLAQEHQASVGSMGKNLCEAKRELWFLGRERQYDIEDKVVDCLTGLAQDLGGLRSAAFAQFAFLDEALAEASPGTVTPQQNGTPNGHPQYPSILDVITEAPEESQSGRLVDSPAGTITPTTPDRRQSLESNPPALDKPADMFLAFIAQLGPPTKSLVYTLKQILDELPFRPAEKTGFMNTYANVPSVEVAVNERFHSSLKRAIELYRQSRNEALQKLYASPIDRRPEAILADIEEVSACCGHFSFSLLDFAEDVLTYLDVLEELKVELQHPRRSWRWLVAWWPCKTEKGDGKLSAPPKRFQGHNEDHDTSHDIPTHIQRADAFADLEKSKQQSPWRYQLYRTLGVFRRDDVRFAIKVGLGALLYALPAYVASTRPFFVHWRGEWGLVSYMAVCSMTVGASNTTSINRLIGTCIGALLAILAWLIASDHGDANPWLLGIFGWLVSLGCFYLIIAKNNGPMGRFILLTYNLGALYSYSLSIQDDDNDDDEGGIDPAIWDIVMHRLVAVIVGCIWAVIVTRFIWPISARRKLKDGLCVLWLRMGLVWKRDPLAMFLLGEPRSSYMDIREEALLQAFLSNLEGLRKAAESEFELRGPFPDKIIGTVLEHTGRMLDSFHAMNVVISKNLQYTPGEAAVLRYTRPERFELSARISHLFSVLASSMKLEYPLNDVLPSIEHTRDRLLAKISEFRRTGEGREEATEQDYELLYAFVLVTGQLSQDIQAVSAELETLYGTLNEDNLKLQ
ncbi:hypothetical protein BAUCODRAFT_71630 [Baudoinia panamericana UAMH 10762]|uniref:Integral membrane bound transporter domain-containing protein n=1 Tax=Baudoinia panamericana (strain UAMH 10762) TaxID=717646 RepID=M2MWX2_BAUPA|nr:uncharacterized protein BAUCODRAFT_71630 [Baudoinia panamericana UAMH 10762]EMC96028.1 hypothetical protein BAUCODRAFT_71630 [Baudoinia panamericana UAMH 10762]